MRGLAVIRILQTNSSRHRKALVSTLSDYIETAESMSGFPRKLLRLIVSKLQHQPVTYFTIFQDTEAFLIDPARESKIGQRRGGDMESG